MPNKSKTIQTNNKDWFSRIPWTTRLVVLYVAVVLLVDLLTITSVTWPIRWSMLSWKAGELFSTFQGTIFDRFDLFKFVFWFLLPAAVCLPRMDWTYLLRGRWNRWDYILVGILALFGMAAMFIIPLVPELRQFYPSLSDWTAEARLHFFLTRVVWIASWLVGWEFMHRYWLLRMVQREPLEPGWPSLRAGQWGWMAVPVLETLYHLQKAPLEAAGMFCFSVVLTLWCLKRGNWLVAFLIHLIIEVELLLFMTLVA